jgi:hypothetical protein
MSYYHKRIGDFDKVWILFIEFGEFSYDYFFKKKKPLHFLCNGFKLEI